jgi:beta-glucosidase
VGVNYYTRARVRRAWFVPFLGLWPEGLPVPTGQVKPPDDAPEGIPRASGMGWEVYPAGLFELLWRLKTEYGNPPVYVTENGAAYPDVLTADGRVHDEARRAYLEQHLAVVAAAVQGGVDARGYFVWSLLDNFEWTYGYDKRFGLVYVDYATQRRVIKDSGLWYSEFIRRRR